MDYKTKNISYPYMLDYKPGFFLGWFFYRLFRKVRIDENIKENLKAMQKEGTIVYAIKYRGILDYLLYHFSLRRRRLPYPKIAFDLNISLILPLSRLYKVIVSNISARFKHGKFPGPYSSGFYENAIKERTPALISLLDPAGFLKSFVHSEKSHLQFLLDLQRKMDTPIYIVPQLILFKRTPEKENIRLRDILFGYKDNLGLIRKIILFFRSYRSTFIDFAEPVNLMTYLKSCPSSETSEKLAHNLKEELIERIDNQKRVILGPIMKSRQQLKETVLNDRGISELIEKMAEGDRAKIIKKRQKAGEYFDEIAADYNPSYVQIFRIILKWLWKRIFEGIDTVQSDLATVREWARKGPLIYIPSHKSHIDYLVLNYILYDNNMHVPRIAAGQNLSFWPMGHIFRKCGAFFIRRSFRGAKLYAEVFSRYVKALLKEGHPIQFYIEGGRSRNGKLILPKTGFLSILLNAHEEGYCNDLVFVPTSIIYDRIIEKGSYINELGGGKKETENFRQVLSARRFLKMRFGNIYIRFNKPFSLNAYRQKTDLKQGEFHRNLAHHLVSAINEVSPITPLSLVSTAILTSHRKGFFIDDLADTVSLFLNLARRLEIPVSNSLKNPEKAVEQSVGLLSEWKIIEHMENSASDEKTFFFTEDDKKLELEYYKNCIIHFFIEYSFTAVALLSGKEEEKTQESVTACHDFLKKTFGKEFIFNSKVNTSEKVASIIDYFTEEGFIKESDTGEGFSITKSGFDKLPAWAALAKTFIESYWTAADVIYKNRSEKLSGENLLKKIGTAGNKYYKSGVIDHIGSISRLNFRNAVAFINRNVLLSEDSEGNSIQDYDSLSEFSGRLHDLIR